MGEVIEKSTSAYSTRYITHFKSLLYYLLMYFFREDAQTKLLALKDKADKELAQYRMELKVTSIFSPYCFDSTIFLTVIYCL